MKIPEVVDISYQILSALLRDLEVDEDGFATILVTFKNTSSESFVGGVLEVRTIKVCCYCSRITEKEKAKTFSFFMLFIFK